MSRWDGVMKALPRPLRNRRLLDALAAMDQRLLDGKAYGSITIEAHYAAGDPAETKVAALENSGKPEL